MDLTEISPGVYSKRRPELRSGLENIHISVLASQNTIDETCSALGISAWRLSKLLDVSDPSVSVKWGKTSSISSLFLGRIAKLTRMKLYNVDFSDIVSIDWSTGEILRRDSKTSEQSKGDLPRSKRSVPKQNGQNRKRLTDTSHKQERPNAPHHNGESDMVGVQTSQIELFPRTRKYVAPNPARNAGPS